MDSKTVLILNKSQSYPGQTLIFSLFETAYHYDSKYLIFQYILLYGKFINNYIFIYYILYIII